MPMTLIKGRFRIVGASPDGDSVRFYPDDENAFASAGLKVRVNAAGGAQLRLDGVDALETHYRPRVSGAGMWHQPEREADAAAAGLLDRLGFETVQRDEDGTVVAASPESTPGYILTRFADTYGRAVATVFSGRRRGRQPDGGPVHLDVDELRRSANFHLVESGLAYPTFYSMLYVDLRAAMAAAAAAAREARRGVWERDATLAGFRLTSRRQLQDEVVILPKLFRRLVDYLARDDSGRVSLARFSDYLDARNDRLFTLPDGHATELHTLVEIRRQTTQLTVEPERIVFHEA